MRKTYKTKTMTAIIITIALALIGGTLLAVGLIQMEKDFKEYEGDDFLNQ